MSDVAKPQQQQQQQQKEGVTAKVDKVEEENKSQEATTADAETTGGDNNSTPRRRSSRIAGKRKDETPTKEEEPKTKKQRKTPVKKELEALNVGEDAPKFDSTDSEGNKVSLSDLSGKIAILHFYVKDTAPNSKKVALAFNSHVKDFEALGAQVYVVSSDSVQAHKSFKEKNNLSFTLLSDAECNVIKSFKVLNPKANGARSATYVIGKDQKVLLAYPKLTKPENHPATLLEDLKNALSKPNGEAEEKKEQEKQQQEKQQKEDGGDKKDEQK